MRIIKGLSGKLCFIALFVGVSGLNIFAQKKVSIAEIEGDKNVSPLFGKDVKTSGIVTARTRNGFFMQTPDDKTDGNPQTSEGIFVFTGKESPAQATLGNLVELSATVDEFKPKSEPAALPLTELKLARDATIFVVSKNNPLPKPIVLTRTDFLANRSDELEKYEGMRVQADELIAVAPTGGRVNDKTATSESNGIFFGVLKTVPRPFREIGMDVIDAIVGKLNEKMPNLPIFDGNPEVLRIESAGQLGAQSLEVTSFTQLNGLVGVMSFAYGRYAILPDVDNKPTVTGFVKATPLPPTTDKQFAIAGMNLENFFDDQDDPAIKEDIVTTQGFEIRLKKISMAVREILQTPDVVGTVEVENLAALKRLAEKINSDAVAAGKPNPQYEAFLSEGNDGRGIDSGFLVKTSRVKVVKVEQFGKAEKFDNPSLDKEIFLNDRPPLLLQAQITDSAGGKPVEFTVIVNHLKSFRGIDDPKQMEGVRLKKKLQAEFLAKFIDARQKANPQEKIALVGDFNAYQFNDGIVDVIGTIKGKPAPKDQVLLASEDLVNPDLVDLVDLIDKNQKYSYSFDGNAQVIDHIIVNESLKKNLAGFGYARINADYPESYRNNPNRLERFSDHDAAIAYFSFDEKTSPPKPAPTSAPK